MNLIEIEKVMVKPGHNAKLADWDPVAQANMITKNRRYR